MPFPPSGENTLDKYNVKLYPHAYRDIDEIYGYIASNFANSSTASKIIGEPETVIFSLETMPERGSVRRVGVYANRGYRQLFYKNYTILYRVSKEKKEVHIITVRYTPSNF